MTNLARLASMQNRHDEEPNLLLVRELVEKQDVEGIREIACNLWHKDKRIQSDCDSVLSEYTQVLNQRPESLSTAQARRVKKLLREFKG